MRITPADAHTLVRITEAAGACIMPYFRREHGARKKADRSPVTDADLAAHDYIHAQLAAHFPGVPVISEEDAAHASLAGAEYFFLVDPLDGTRSFVRGEDEFTVNIGLIERARPVFGAIGAPARGVTYWGGVDAPPMRSRAGAQAEAIHARPTPQEGVTLTRSRAHPSAVSEAFLASLTIAGLKPASSSIKFCWVAEGSADIYPRFGRTMEWDTAAGHAIVNAAGGRMTQADGQEFLYCKPGFENPAFVVRGA